MSTSMYGKPAFAGTGEAALSSAKVRTAQDVAVEASLMAIADAGISPRDIDGMITASPAADPPFVFSSLVTEALNIPARPWADADGIGVPKFQPLG